MNIVIQIVGSLLVLAGFALAQWEVLDPKSVWYLVLNVIGSGILAVDAVFEAQWGFLLLEGVWAIVSLIGLIGVLRSRTARRTIMEPTVAASRRDDGARRED
ncbi:hypothetical protein [Planctomonas sp. JC2975]|uniref:CBU_0592 family membrane protein n=1 Tax=Planctomonas sp. JC2975 TaxID=2729626 RepID=UPI00197B36B2|nr:hypothetical protein [Planctomonas sp. JC2975]